MAEHFKTSVILDGKNLQSVSRINLNQDIFDHHRFNMHLPLSSLVNMVNNEDPFPALQGCIGRSIEITIKTATDADRDGQQDQSVFKGIVTNVRVLGHRWEHAMVNIAGSSPTILMDDIPNSQAFSQKGIKQIFETCVAKHLSSEIKMEDNLSYTENLMYTVQYNESSFDFIKRLCYQYGEWCYYDGSSLCLGLQPANKPVVISKDRTLGLDYDYSINTPRPNTTFRNYKKHDTEKVSPKKVKLKDDMASFSLSESANLFPGGSDSNSYAPSHFSGDGLQNEKSQLQHQLDVSESTAMANVLTISCQTDVAGISVGSTVRLEGLTHNGDFVVTSITHNCYDAKSYSNHFIAIPKDALFPTEVNIRMPEVRECSAVVKDNKDPEKLGRVRVQFDWGLDTASPWIRMVMPHTGDNRGFYFVPEIGDEVMVGFEMGNPDYPYVIGSLFNGENNFGKRAKDNNNLKSIKTKSGNEILFDDGGQIIIRNNHNSFELICAEDGKIVLKTDGDMELTSGKKFAITAGTEMSISSGTVMTVSAGAKLDIKAGKDLSIGSKQKGSISSDSDLALSSKKGVKMTAGKDLALDATNLKATAKANMELKGTAKAELSGGQVAAKGTGTVELSAAGITTVKGSLVKIN